MTADIRNWARDALHRSRMAIGRAILTAVDDSRQVQELQLQLLSDETAEGIERFQQYGVTSVPFPGAEAIMVCVGGLRSHGVIIAVEDRRYRLASLEAGEVALYDDQGQMVHLKRDGIHIETSLKVVVSAGGDLTATVGGALTANVSGAATITADSLALGGEGGPAVARVGDHVVGGVITTGSAKVTAA